MKKLIIMSSMVACLLAPSIGHAQADVELYQLKPKVALKFQPKKVIDKNFIAVSSYLVLMTVFDVETTFAVIHNGGHEENALMKPLFSSGRPAVYGVQLGVDALVILLAYEMKKSSHKEFNQTWWVAPMVVGTTHGICGGLNMRYVW
jgi:hypothetical protein